MGLIPSKGTVAEAMQEVVRRGIPLKISLDSLVDLLAREYERRSGTNLCLEDYIDRVGLTNALLTVVGICRDKADRLRSDWQEKGSADQWDRAADAIDGLAARSGDWP